jgi:WD40 repeat protein
VETPFLSHVSVLVSFQLQGTIEETLDRVKTITSETSLRIMFYPLAAFRIRPVMRCTATIQAHSEAILTVSFSPDSRFVASGSGDTTVETKRIEKMDILKHIHSLLFVRFVFGI